MRRAFVVLLIPTLLLLGSLTAFAGATGGDGGKEHDNWLRTFVPRILAQQTAPSVIQLDSRGAQGGKEFETWQRILNSKTLPKAGRSNS